MEKSEWLKLTEHAPSAVLHGLAWRVVESQEQIATMVLVDSLAEQAVLEDLLESSKPAYQHIDAANPNPQDSERNYLLATPFRYPPLAWGSRFGNRFEPSLYYASTTVDTALAESAYYRMVFWYGMVIPPAHRLITQHTVFQARYHCRPGMALQAPPFSAYQDLLTDRQHYQNTQNLGAAMREHGVAGFSYVSARCPASGLNIALFTVDALASRRPQETQSWICETHAQGVSFKSNTKTRRFSAEVFFVDGQLPVPA